MPTPVSVLYRRLDCGSMAQPCASRLLRLSPRPAAARALSCTTHPGAPIANKSGTSSRAIRSVIPLSMRRPREVQAIMLQAVRRHRRPAHRDRRRCGRRRRRGAHQAALPPKRSRTPAIDVTPPDCPLPRHGAETRLAAAASSVPGLSLPIGSVAPRNRARPAARQADRAASAALPGMTGCTRIAICAQHLRRHIEDGLHALGVGLFVRPGLLAGEIAVGVGDHRPDDLERAMNGEVVDRLGSTRAKQPVGRGEDRLVGLA